MKSFFVICFAFLFLSVGFVSCLNQIKITKALDEIIRFINLIKLSVNYTSAGFDDIVLKGKKQSYRFISFSDGEIYLDKSVPYSLREDFNSFVDKIGTTDQDGQLIICEEYKQSFQDQLFNFKKKEKEKLQVNTALSVFGAVTILIFFL